MTPELAPRLLHPVLRELLAQPNQVADHPGIERARRAFDAEIASVSAAGPEMQAVVDHEVDVGGARITVRLYRPHATDELPAPCLIFFHGGGWMFGSIDTHDSLVRMLAHHSGCAVASVNYRLAPEHPFPVPVQDCVRATEWLLGSAARLGLDGERFALGGDSAGANLALAVVQSLDPAKALSVRYLLLLYPVADLALQTISKRLFSKGYWLDSLERQISAYLQSPAMASNPLASPLRAADMACWPMARIVTAGFDPLRDEGELLARAMIERGVAAEYICYPQYVHGFLSLSGLLPEVAHVLAECGSALRRGVRTTEVRL